jgi:hypothetical protein
MKTILKVILNIDMESGCADKLHSDTFCKSTFRKDVLISADWKHKNFRECAEIEQMKRLMKKFIGSAKQQKC